MTWSINIQYKNSPCAHSINFKNRRLEYKVKLLYNCFIKIKITVNIEQLEKKIDFNAISNR